MVEENNKKEPTRNKFGIGRRKSSRSKIGPVDEINPPIETEDSFAGAEVLQSVVDEDGSEVSLSVTEEAIEPAITSSATEAEDVSNPSAAAEATAKDETPADSAVEESTKTTTPTKARSRSRSTSKKAPAATTTEKSTEPEASAAAETQVEEPQKAPAAPAIVYPELKAESTTSLIFFAPDLPSLAAAPEPSDNARRRQRTRGTSEDRSVRNSENRRTQSEDGTSGRSQDNRDGRNRNDRNDNRGESRGESKEDSRNERPTQLRGSTRLEAKRQRRRENRDVNRRRQVITEVEFQARRESTDRTMVVRTKSGITEIAVLEDKILAEHYVTRSSNVSLIGNVYLGRVQNVLPSMEAAFVDIGRGRNAVLYSGEVDWDSADNPGGQRRIELALKSGDQVLVQVTKDPVGHKGARLTSQVSLPGRYLVFVPNGDMNGISRKLAEPERVRLKKILKEIVPENSGVIVRTAAEGATEEQLTLDIKRLTAQWAEIQGQIEKGKPPFLLHSEPDLLTKIIRDVFNEDFQKLVISGTEAVSTINRYLSQIAPDLLDKVEPYTGTQDVFAEYRVAEQISKALDRKVWLPSGGSLIIDRTEAMTVIDVNTGKFIGSGGNLEETVTKNNLESAEEIVRQLRLRDIGGIIVIDFIDMVLESNRDMVLRRLVECLSRDRTKHQVAEVTSLGLVQMTRKKIGLGLAESFEEIQSTVVDDSSQPNGQSARKPRNNNRNRNTNGNGANTAPQARELTEDVKNAVAQIVASTIHPTTGAIPIIEKSDVVAEPVQETAEAVTSVAVVNEKPAQKRSRRSSSNRSANKSAPQSSPLGEGTAARENAANGSAPAAASIIEMPAPSAAKDRSELSAAQLAAKQQDLAGVLDALPAIRTESTSAPSRRSRRVSVNFENKNENGGAAETGE
ncbi:MAG: Rne/Rng family ribonuclease [Microbacteriaceae bacterium]